VSLGLKEVFRAFSHEIDRDFMKRKEFFDMLHAIGDEKMPHN